MCGIAGYISLREVWESVAPMEGMMHAMKHRGPDDSGIWKEGPLTLGFVRLSIIDLSPQGHQPMISDDGRYVIIFNGEVYNYIEIREELQKKGYQFRSKTDTEVILQAYREWGEDALHRFNGMWAIAIYDRAEQRLFCARDRYGIKPFYYMNTGDCLAFASEIPPLLTLLSQKPGADRQSVYEFLVYNRTDQGERTFFQGVRKLAHGHCMNISMSNPSFEPKRWYHLRSRIEQADPIKSGEEFLHLFKSAVGLRLRADVPVGVCLSGGLDSSAITSVLLECFQKKDLHSFSAVYGRGKTGDESEYIDEFGAGRLIRHNITPTAESLFADLDAFTCTHAEPVPTTSIYAHFKVMELARRHVVVTLDGQGADEELAGYPYFFGFYYRELLRQWKWGRWISEVLQNAKRHKSAFALKTMAYFMLPGKWQTQWRIRHNGYFTPDFRAQHYQSVIADELYASPDLSSALYNHFEYKLEHLLKWVDLNSMHFSLESRVPFLDYRLVEGLLSSPSRNLIRNGQTKWIMREGLSGILPEKIRQRQSKIGFETPQNDWFRTPVFSRFILEIINDNQFRERNLIDPQKALALFAQHQQGKRDLSREIWKWVNLELWYRKWTA